jgi:hypothetical protein
MLRCQLFLANHSRNQQPSEQPPNDFGLSDFERPIQFKPFVLLVPGGGVEPPWPQGPADFESAASASSAIPAYDLTRYLLFICTPITVVP